LEGLDVRSLLLARHRNFHFWCLSHYGCGLLAFCHFCGNDLSTLKLEAKVLIGVADHRVRSLNFFQLPILAHNFPDSEQLCTRAAYL